MLLTVEYPASTGKVERERVYVSRVLPKTVRFYQIDTGANVYPPQAFIFKRQWAHTEWDYRYGRSTRATTADKKNLFKAIFKGLFKGIS